MDNIYNIISDMNVPVGTTVRTKCPSCGQRTFTVTNNMGSLVWNCFRMSCDLKGGTRVRMSVDDIRTQQGMQEAVIGRLNRQVDNVASKQSGQEKRLSEAEDWVQSNLEFRRQVQRRLTELEGGSTPPAG